MNLFLYIDLNFSFNFGHYRNIFGNIHEVCLESGTEMKLVHSEWKYYSASETEGFEDLEGFSRLLVNNPDQFVREIVREVAFASYDRITVYIYKGGIEFVAPLAELHDHLSSIGKAFEIWNTLFLIPFDHLNLEQNTFDRPFEKKIQKARSLLESRDINLCFDVDHSIWDKYFDKVHFLAPPLLDDNKIIAKRTRTQSEVTMALDVWNLRHAPKYRNEEIGLLIAFLEEILDRYAELKVKVKIADSAFSIDPIKDAFFVNHPRIELITYLDKKAYERFIAQCDIYILQYAPTFYKNKSSGHFLELLKNNVFTIGTKDTFLEKYSINKQYNYRFGDLKSLIEVCSAALNNKAYLQDNRLNDSHTHLLTSWSKPHFKNTLLNTNVKKSQSASKNMKRTNKPFVILGNGPSLKGFDFFRLEGYDTIGMNAAYRYWDRINWYPTYYICLDTVVVKSHHHEIDRLVQESDKLGIKKFFVRQELFELEPQLEHHPKVITYEEMKRRNPLAFDCVHVTTGSFAARFGIYEGYKDLIMLGIDETYVNFIKESKRKENITLEITETPDDNPNYFFADYQQKGDQYQIANHSKVYNCHCRHCNGEQRNGETLHVDAWKFIRDDLENPDFIRKYGQVRIINGNPKSAVPFFPFAEFDEALNILAEQRKSVPTPVTGVTIQETTLDSISNKKLVLPMISFFGTEKLVENDNRIASIIEEMPAYRIEVNLKSYYNRHSFDDFGDNAPPMPFVIGPFALFDMGSRYTLNVNVSKGYEFCCDFENTFDWTTLSIAYNSDSKTLAVFVNGVAIFDNSFSDIKYTGQSIQLGCGFKKRYWKGEIEYVKLFDTDEENSIVSYDKYSLFDNLSLKQEGNADPSPWVTTFSHARKKRSEFELDPTLQYYSSTETGQDKWVIQMLKGQRNGFFIDIGASDGKASNNTLTLEKFFDWKGICVEGNKKSFEKLKAMRNKAICLNSIVSDEAKEVQWRKNVTASERSGINATLPEDNENKSWREGDLIKRTSETLGSILDTHNAPGIIDYLSIDIEGGEVNALKTFPFDKYMVKLISAEVSYNNRGAFRELMRKNGFKEVNNPFNSADYEFFFVNESIIE